MKPGRRSQRHLIKTELIRTARRELGITSEKMAEIMDVCWSTYQRWERGSVLPTTEQVARLEEQMGFEPGELIEGGI